MAIRFSYLALAFLFFADQLTKIIVESIPDLSRFTNPVCNSGIAWSVPVKPAFFYPAWIIILFFLAKLLAKEKNQWNIIALIMLLAGGSSNMLDRIHYGCVMDFIDLKFFPVFNLADIYITMGAILLILNYFKIEMVNSIKRK